MNDTLSRERMTPVLRSHLEDPAVRLAHGYEFVAMPLIVFLMVFKLF